MQFRWMLVYAALVGLSAADSSISAESQESDDSPICSEPTNPTNFTFSDYIGKKLFVKYFRSRRQESEVDGVTFVFEEDTPDTYNITVKVVRNENVTKDEYHQWTATPSKHEVVMGKGENVTIYSIPYLDNDSTVLHLCTATSEADRRHFIQVLSTSLDFDPTKALEEAKKIPLAGEFLRLPYKYSSRYADE